MEVSVQKQWQISTINNFYIFASVEDSLLLSAKLCGKAVVQVGHLPLFQVLEHLKHIQLNIFKIQLHKRTTPHTWKSPGHNVIFKYNLKTQNFAYSYQIFEVFFEEHEMNGTRQSNIWLNNLARSKIKFKNMKKTFKKQPNSLISWTQSI